jgi:hypothetical protein
MNIPLGLCLALMLVAVAEAAEPPVAAPVVAKPVRSTAAPVKRAPLDLRVGDIRKYMMPNEFRAAISAPDADKYAIVVEGNRPSPELQSLRAVPMGLPALFWGFAHPGSAWRLFVPDVNAEASGPILTKVPPPVFRWGP